MLEGTATYQVVDDAGPPPPKTRGGEWRETIDTTPPAGSHRKVGPLNRKQVLALKAAARNIGVLSAMRLGPDGTYHVWLWRDA